MARWPLHLLLRPPLARASSPPPSAPLFPWARRVSAMPPQPPQPRLSPGTDAAAVMPALAALLAAGRPWLLSADGQALERTFKFKTFAKTWDFMTAVALQCKIKNHHPEWSNVYNTTFVRWTTHEPRGLSAKDVAMAAVCDAVAKDLGELDPDPAGSPVRQLVENAAASAGPDCCAPKR